MYPAVSRALVPFALAVSFAAAANADAQDLSDAQVTAVRAAVEAHADADEPGFAWALWRGGAIVSSGARGMADLERDVPLSVDSRFRIASTSKQFTAASILALVEDGTLDLETPVHEIVEELHAFDPPVRLRHLVAHQSGLPDYLFLMDLKGYPPALPYSFDEVLDVLSRIERTIFEPGSDYAYSNTNYLLMSEVVRRASGSSLRAFAHERLFAPLGMQHTHYGDDRDELVPDRALGYARGTDGAWRLSLTPLELVGDGGVFTTVGDLFRWTQDMRVERDERVGVFDADAVERQLTPFARGEGPGDYAFGLLVERVADGRLVSHGGAFVGYRADCLHCPEAGWGVAVLFNRADGRPTNLGIELLNAIGVDTRLVRDRGARRGSFDTDAEVPPLPEWALDLRGTRMLSDGTPVRLLRVGEFLRVQGPSVDVRLAASAHDATRLVSRDSSATLAATTLGLVLELEGGESVRLQNDAPPPAPSAGYGALAGRWRVRELDAVWSLERRESRREVYDVFDARGSRGRVTPLGPELARGPLASLIWFDGEQWCLWATELGVLHLERVD